MDKKFLKVLTVCIAKAREGETDMNIFDLMYETSLPYSELKEIIDTLISDDEVVQLDIKTYRFIGDVNRDFDELEEKRKPVFQNVETNPSIGAALAAKRADFDRRRKEINERIRLAQEVIDEIEDEQDDEPVGDLSEYVIRVFTEKLNPDVFIEPPIHPSWPDKKEFNQTCADNLIILMNSDKQMSRVKAIKKARILLGELHRARNDKTAEVYEYLVYGLSYMSNYYYNKIRENLS